MEIQNGGYRTQYSSSTVDGKDSLMTTLQLEMANELEPL